MSTSRKLRGIAAVVAAGIAAAAGAAAVSHGSSGSTSTVSAAAFAGQAQQGGRGFPGLAAAASYLGLSTSELQSQLRGGETLAQVASSTVGRSEAGLVAALVAAEQNAGSTESKNAIAARVTAMITVALPPRRHALPDES